MSTPKVSILVPIYNVAPFIERCAESLFRQTLDEIEYVFVNDCTPDNSMEILQEVIERFPERKPCVKIISHEKNTGIAQVRNTLLDNATGEYVQFVDSDDWIEPNMVEVMYNKAVETGADMVTSDFYLSYPDKEVYNHENHSENYETNLKRLISLTFLSVLWKVFVKNSVYQVNNIRCPQGFNLAEDYAVSLQLYYYSRSFAIVPQALYHYVQYNNYCYSRQSLGNILDRQSSVRWADSYCREKGIIGLVQNELNGRKFIVKKSFLLDEEYIDFNRWKTTFPEANRAWRQFPWRADYKLIFWLAERHWFWGVRLINWCKRLMH